MDWAGGDGVDARERFWRRQARRVAARVNLGSWLHAWLPWQAGLTVAAGLLLLAVRRSGGSPPPLFVWSAWIVSTIAAGTIAYLRTRARFDSPRDALVRIEARLRLHNRLSAAAAGVGEWPAPHSPEALRPRWRAARIGPALVVPLGLLAAAALVQISPATEPPAEPAAPLSWQRVEEWLAELEEQELVSEDSAETWHRRLDELRSGPPESWYDHAALEAGDALRTQLGGAIAELSGGLESAARGVADIDADGPGAPVSEALLETLGRLESAELALDPELAATLRRASDRDLRELTSADMDALERRLDEGAAACRSLLGRCPPGSSHCIAVPRPGQGSPRRGPGPAPLSWVDAAADGVEPTLEGVSGSGDASRAALGELISTSRGAHVVEDGDFEGSVPSGSAPSGTGGDAVWRDALTPQEREILRRYFR
jgi:hypothetical protein